MKNLTAATTIAWATVSACVLSACAVDVDRDADDVGSIEQAAKNGTIQCGGFAGLTCPDGMECVDVPGDGCDPDNGGADCSGQCRKSPGRSDKGKCAHADPDTNYVAYGDTCQTILFLCQEGYEPFFDECGCGCRLSVGEECNNTTCSVGEFCCNWSCSQCVPDGGFCTQQVCEEAPSTL